MFLCHSCMSVLNIFSIFSFAHIFNGCLSYFQSVNFTHHPGPRPRSHSTSQGSTHLCFNHNQEEHHHYSRTEPDSRHLSHSFHPNSYQVYHGPPSPHPTQGGHMPSNIDPRPRQSSQLVVHGASYQTSAHLPNLDHSSQVM